MMHLKEEILQNIGYTELVYGRINKKLHLNLSNEQIEDLIREIITETNATNFEKIGKNIYINNASHKVRLTINSSSKRIITANKLK